MASYFNKVFKRKAKGKSWDDLYVPFTNANDFTSEIALVPSNRKYFRATTSRAYYDEQYAKYRKMLRKYGISAISTFAIVDPEKDKNHTGWYWVKVQRKVKNRNNGRLAYRYLVAKIDRNGQFARRPDGVPDLDMFFSENPSEMLCVCE